MEDLVLAEAGFPREGFFLPKTVSLSFAFSVPQAFSKKKRRPFPLDLRFSSHRPFPVAAWFLPEGVSGRRLTTQS